jgi:hypothetical protein
MLVVTKFKMLELLSNFTSIFKEMKVVAARRLNYLTKSIDDVKKEFSEVIVEMNTGGHTHMDHEFAESGLQKED